MDCHLLRGVPAPFVLCASAPAQASALVSPFSPLSFLAPRGYCPFLNMFFAEVPGTPQICLVLVGSESVLSIAEVAVTLAWGSPWPPPHRSPQQVPPHPCQ